MVRRALPSARSPRYALFQLLAGRQPWRCRSAGWCASGRTHSGRSLRHLAGKADRWLHMDEDSGSARPLRPTPRMSERCLIRTRTLAWAEWYYLRKDVKKLRPYKPLAGLLQRVVAALPHGAGIFRSGLAGQGVQHHGQRGGAARREIPRDPPGAADRRIDPQRPVIEPAVVAAGPGAGPFGHLLPERTEVVQVRATQPGGQQNLIRVRPMVVGEPDGPLTDLPRPRRADLRPPRLRRAPDAAPAAGPTRSPLPPDPASNRPDPWRLLPSCSALSSCSALFVSAQRSDQPLEGGQVRRELGPAVDDGRQFPNTVRSGDR